jgi:acyl-CoA reductase-like NAD-dependent aldehyde dehydrogenase
MAKNKSVLEQVREEGEPITGTSEFYSPATNELIGRVATQDAFMNAIAAVAKVANAKSPDAMAAMQEKIYKNIPDSQN